MEFVADGVVVIDCPTLISQSYDDHIPADPPAVEHPYLVRSLVEKDSVEQNGVSMCYQGEDSNPAPRSTKRQKRQRQHPSNPKEEAFNKRHATIEPLLTSALEKLNHVMIERGAVSVRQVLNLPQSTFAGLPPPANDASPAPLPPDYIALASLCHVAHPKFCWDKTSTSTTISEEEKDEEGQEVDLFGSLISNRCPTECWATAFDHPVILPSQSSFFLSDHTQLKTFASLAAPFQCIVIDPPWENRSVKRRRNLYPVMPNYNMLPLPISELAGGPGGVCLVALWVTNREKLREFIEQRLLEAWGLRHVATWHWIKVAGDGQPVTPLGEAHHRPYESLLLCYHGECAPSRKDGSDAYWAAPIPPDGLVILGSPMEHSRKPPLHSLLEPFLPKDARCLEMFARSMTKGWTSWGNEVLKFQGAEHFRGNELQSEVS